MGYLSELRNNRKLFSVPNLAVRNCTKCTEGGSRGGGGEEETFTKYSVHSTELNLLLISVLRPTQPTRNNLKLLNLGFLKRGSQIWMNISIETDWMVLY